MSLTLIISSQHGDFYGKNDESIPLYPFFLRPEMLESMDTIPKNFLIHCDPYLKSSNIRKNKAE